MMKSDPVINPENCSDMAQVRAGVDALDREIVALLVRRFAYMDAAARIKTDRSLVRDDDRKAQVLANVATQAADAGLDSRLLLAVWDHLVEQSIAYEFTQWDRIRAGYTKSC
jgi:isochorismate pyruvate lyase